MSKKPIYGYLFAIVAEKAEKGYIAYCPGIHGVYEEARYQRDAIRLAYKSACSILEVRAVMDDLIEEDNEYLKVLRELPTAETVRTAEPSEQRTAPEYLMTMPCRGCA